MQTEIEAEWKLGGIASTRLCGRIRDRPLQGVHIYTYRSDPRNESRQPRRPIYVNVQWNDCEVLVFPQDLFERAIEYRSPREKSVR